MFSKHIQSVNMFTKSDEKEYILGEEFQAYTIMC